MTKQIPEHRKRIDELDAQILELIQERVSEAIQIRELKIAQNIPLNTPEREEQLIQMLVEQSDGKLAADVIEDIWRTIIKGGKRTGQKPL